MVPTQTSLRHQTCLQYILSQLADIATNNLQQPEEFPNYTCQEDAADAWAMLAGSSGDKNCSVHAEVLHSILLFLKLGRLLTEVAASEHTDNCNKAVGIMWDIAGRPLPWVASL